MTSDDQRTGDGGEDVVMGSTKLKIGLLVAGHVAVVFPLAWIAHQQHFRRDLAVGAYLSLVFAEAGLLGIWGALGTTRPSWRFPAVLAMAAFLGAVNVAAEGNWPHLAVEMFLLVAFPSAVILVVLSVLRYGRRKLRLTHLAASPAAVEGFQFTLRHLFLTTTVVAVVLAIGRGVMSRAVANFADNGLATMFVVAVTIPSLIIVELATVWGALGIGRPTRRLAIVLPTAFVLGLVPPFFQQTIMGSDWQRFMGWSLVCGLQAIITAGSLLVIRSCGWRLVRGTNGEDQPVSP